MARLKAAADALFVLARARYMPVVELLCNRDITKALPGKPVDELDDLACNRIEHQVIFAFRVDQIAVWGK